MNETQRTLIAERDDGVKIFVDRFGGFVPVHSDPEKKNLDPKGSFELAIELADLTWSKPGEGHLNARPQNFKKVSGSTHPQRRPLGILPGAPIGSQCDLDHDTDHGAE